MSTGALLRSNAAHMAGGFALMGGWAVFANRAHGWPDALTAGLVQGCLTAVITLGLKRGIEAIAARSTGLAALIAPPLAAFATSLTILSVIHSLAGTPEVWLTIALPLAVSTTYAALYALALWRDRA